MGLPRDLAKAVRRLDEPQLRQLLILARGLLIDTEAAVRVRRGGGKRTEEGPRLRVVG